MDSHSHNNANTHQKQDDESTQRDIAEMYVVVCTLYIVVAIYQTRKLVEFGHI